MALPLPPITQEMRESAAKSAIEKVRRSMARHGPKPREMARKLKEIVESGKDRDAIQAIKLILDQAGAMAPQKQDVTVDGKIDVTVQFVNAGHDEDQG